LLTTGSAAPISGYESPRSANPPRISERRSVNAASPAFELVLAGCATHRSRIGAQPFPCDGVPAIGANAECAIREAGLRTLDRTKLLDVAPDDGKIQEGLGQKAYIGQHNRSLG